MGANFPYAATTSAKLQYGCNGRPITVLQVRSSVDAAWLFVLEQAGVVKMNVDTDTQWTYWEGIKDFYQVRR